MIIREPGVDGLGTRNSGQLPAGRSAPTVPAAPHTLAGRLPEQGSGLLWLQHTGTPVGS